MDNNQKLEALYEVFETENLTPETQLDTLQWDSMAMLSVMALIKANGKSVTGQAVREMTTVNDILEAM